MNTKGLQRLYDRLQPLERFQLTMAAYERGDDNELRALIEKAPIATYRLTDWPYRGMLTGVERVAWAVIIDILTNGVYLVLAWRMLSGNDTSLSPDVPLTVITATARNILVMWESLTIFCGNLGITTDQVFAITPARDTVDYLVTLAQAVNPLNVLANRTSPVSDDPGIEEALTVVLEEKAQKCREDAQRLAVYLREQFNHQAYSD